MLDNISGPTSYDHYSKTFFARERPAILMTFLAAIIIAAALLASVHGSLFIVCIAAAAGLILGAAALIYKNESHLKEEKSAISRQFHRFFKQESGEPSAENSEDSPSPKTNI